MHLLGYVGAPSVREALLVAKETLRRCVPRIRSRHNSELAALRHFGRENRDVGFWPKADMLKAGPDVRFEGKADIAKPTGVPDL